MKQPSKCRCLWNPYGHFCPICDCQMWSAIDRLKTFLQLDWPPHKGHPYFMAEAGLYYTGISDYVKCFECKVELGNWRHVEDPAEEHRRESPNCRFVNCRNTANFPIHHPPYPLAIQRLMLEKHRMAVSGCDDVIDG